MLFGEMILKKDVEQHECGVSAMVEAGGMGQCYTEWSGQTPLWN